MLLLRFLELSRVLPVQGVESPALSDKVNQVSFPLNILQQTTFIQGKCQPDLAPVGASLPFFLLKTSYLMLKAIFGQISLKCQNPRTCMIPQRRIALKQGEQD